jgi:hypothetical protein
VNSGFGHGGQAGCFGCFGFILAKSYFDVMKNIFVDSESVSICATL